MVRVRSCLAVLQSQYYADRPPQASPAAQRVAQEIGAAELAIVESLAADVRCGCRIARAGELGVETQKNKARVYLRIDHGGVSTPHS